MRTLIAALFLVAASGAQAQVYVCDDNGHKTFSQTPCGTDARSVELNTGDGSITLTPEITEESSQAVCRLMLRGVDIANRLSKQRISPTVAQQRISGFLREHITNYDDIVRANPAYVTAISHGSSTITRYGYTTDHMTDDEHRAMLNDCADSVYQYGKNAGSSLSGGSKRPISQGKNI